MIFINNYKGKILMLMMKLTLNVDGQDDEFDHPVGAMLD